MAELIPALIVETPPFDACQQMAADETLCDTLPAPHILRFYNWKCAGVTFGYSQRYKAVMSALSAGENRAPAAVRRPTGGGIVVHETDLTFSFIFPAPEVYFEPVKTYNRLHSAISAQYSQLGLNFDLLGEATADYAVNDPVMNCFSKPVSMDMLYNGKKVLGGALRKFGSRMLYQASFQAEDARSRADFHRNVILKALGREYGIRWHSTGADQATIERISSLARLKYATPAWNERI